MVVVLEMLGVVVLELSLSLLLLLFQQDVLDQYPSPFGNLDPDNTPDSSPILHHSRKDT